MFLGKSRYENPHSMISNRCPLTLLSISPKGENPTWTPLLADSYTDGWSILQWRGFPSFGAWQPGRDWLAQQKPSALSKSAHGLFANFCDKIFSFHNCFCNLGNVGTSYWSFLVVWPIIVRFELIVHILCSISGIPTHPFHGRNDQRPRPNRVCCNLGTAPMRWIFSTQPTRPQWREA